MSNTIKRFFGRCLPQAIPLWRSTAAQHTPSACNPLSFLGADVSAESPLSTADFKSALHTFIRNAVWARFVDNSWRYYAFDEATEIEKDLQYFHQGKQQTAKEVLFHRADVIHQEISTKSHLYDLLSDARSRRLLVTLSAYHILGHRHVRFPYYGERNIQLRKSLEDLCTYSSQADSSLLTRINDESVVRYNLFNLAPIGLNMIMYTNAEMLYRFAAAPQYVCSTANGTIQASAADVVIDCGAALGDTALYFASSVGPSGRVLSIEPNATCIDVFKANMDLNPHIKDRIQLIKAATWDKDGVIRFIQNGPSSRIDESGNISVNTTTIDSLVQDAHLRKVDFIKMDIEGAELNGLKGAVNTIAKHKPKLAISLYHRPEDFERVPRLLAQLEAGYTFYLEHHHMNDWETVLYAAPY